MKFLKNKNTGVIFTWTERLAEKAGMVPYSFPEKDGAPETEGKEALDLSEKDNLEKDWVKQTFGKHLSRVTKEEIEKYAWSIGLEIDSNQSKGDMITAVMAGGNDGDFSSISS